MTRLNTTRGFWKTFFFSIITFGIYPLYQIYAFAKETNIVCVNDGKHTRGLIAFLLLSLITFGIYGIFWMAMLIDRRGRHCEENGVNNRLTVTFYLLTIFILSYITFGICGIIVEVKFIHQQNDINAIYNRRNGMK
jgi:ABC-type phosphate transport system permease subunit